MLGVPVRPSLNNRPFKVSNIAGEHGITQFQSRRANQKITKSHPYSFSLKAAVDSAGAKGDSGGNLFHHHLPNKLREKTFPGQTKITRMSPFDAVR